MALRTARDLRRDNRAAVLRSLYFDGTASRLQLAARTGLSPATVGTVVSELVDDHVVRATGHLDSRGGRPAVLLEVRADRAHALGVDVGETGVRAELFDLRLNPVAAADRPLPPGPPTPDGVAAVVGELVTELAAAVPQGGDLLGVGVGVPGIVDDANETVVHAPSLGWEGAPLRAMLAARAPGPFYLDNGAKTMGRAEAWFGAGRGVDDLVVVLVGTGVGAALLTGGRVYRGAASSAGEWGHTTVSVGGAPCRCGSRGCLEAYVGASAVSARYRYADPSLPAGLATKDVIARLATAAGRGEPAAERALDETATYLAAGLGDLVNLLNPSRIVVGGFVALALSEHLLDRVRRRLPEFALAAAAARVELVPPRFGPDAVALGAATLPLEHFFVAGGLRRDGPLPAMAHVPA